MGKKSQKSIHESQKISPSSLVDSAYSYIIFVFAKVGGLDDTFIEFNPSSYQGVLTPTKDERICSKYGDCTVPFYECYFSVLGFCLPFTSFKKEVLKHLAMAHSQVHLTSWAYVKFYQYWCEYLKRKPYVTLFFHIFKCHISHVARGRNRGLISLESVVRSVWSLPEILPFEERFFQVLPISLKAHAKVCTTGDEMKERCVELFPKY